MDIRYSFNEFVRGAIYLISDYNKTHKSLVSEIRRLSFFIDGFQEIINNLIRMDPEKVEVLREQFERLPMNYSGIIIGAYEDKYIQLLERLIPTTRNSFFATLRGGYKPEYTIGWFSQDTKLRSDEKLNYLKKVDNAKIPIKVRIIIIDPDEMGDFCNDLYRKNFFDRNKNTHVFLIGLDLLKDKLLRMDININGTTITDEYEEAFLYEDYAIFDGCICVKHNGRNSLYLGVQSQIIKMLLPFELLRLRPEFFQKLDINGLYQWKGSTSIPSNYIIHNINGWSHIFSDTNWNLTSDWNAWKKTNCNP